MSTEPRTNYGKLKLLIDGRWVESGSAELGEAYDPGRGAQLAQVPFALPEEADRAVEAAQRAFEKWREISILERVKYLYKLKEVMERRAEELATINTQNHGKTLEESRGELKRSIENVDVAIAVAYTLAKGDTLDQIAAGIDVSMSKEPLGVFSVVCPFNFPLMVPFWFIPYAIVLGDTLVVKPSDLTPVPMQRVAELIQEEVGLPPGVFNMVHGGRQVVEHLIADRDVKGVTFVGSTPVARQIYRMAGEHGKRAIANGGAKNCVLVMPDADLDGSMSNLVSSFFGNTGQRCLAGANLISVGDVHDSLLSKFTKTALALKVGYGLDTGVQMGPLVTEKARKRVSDYVAAGLSEGAKPVSDGRTLKVLEYPEGYYLGATVLDQVTPEMRIAREEVFGPIASVMQAESLDRAIEMINGGTNFGNMACIYTSSGRNAREFRRRVDAGNIGVNIGVAAPSAYYPFGGRRDSFYGILHAQIDTVEFFTDKKVTISKW
ncbi:MAG: CoA-acylating methylmalonate-semialdehyde dehydrogenase [Thaumarchaeota archaeon]|nr:CoA-acylating methylmalonate-semialdehyde dehydrogenase [Nitrososphaerota archaeon]